LGGLGVGFAETIIVHFRELMEAIDRGAQAAPSFADGLRAQEVIHAALVSAGTRAWETVTPVD
jgi:hypothetical protein